MKGVASLILILLLATSAAGLDLADAVTERYGFPVAFVQGEGTLYLDSGLQGSYFVLFDDGSRCELVDFAYSGCGKDRIPADACVPEAKPVWPAERCCGTAKKVATGAGGLICAELEGIDRFRYELRHNPRWWVQAGVAVFASLLLAATVVELLRRD
ncbi:hypothetical protein JXB02_04845 [Candidatus Woesearchaeota archaeon]|nr:hypothetical protein [Candidatus Woesearchaeota archaeon]